MSDPYNNSGLPPIPTKPKWLVRSWWALLILAVLAVLWVHGLLLKEFFK